MFLGSPMGRSRPLFPSDLRCQISDLKAAVMSDLKAVAMSDPDLRAAVMSDPDLKAAAMSDSDLKAGAAQASGGSGSRSGQGVSPSRKDLRSSSTQESPFELKPTDCC